MCSQNAPAPGKQQQTTARPGQGFCFYVAERHKKECLFVTQVRVRARRAHLKTFDTPPRPALLPRSSGTQGPPTQVRVYECKDNPKKYGRGGI